MTTIAKICAIAAKHPPAGRLRGYRHRAQSEPEAPGRRGSLIALTLAAAADPARRDRLWALLLENGDPPGDAGER